MFTIGETRVSDEDQDIQVQELGAEAMENPEKKLKPLITSGSG
jgi:hypothetical protein